MRVTRGRGKNLMMMLMILMFRDRVRNGTWRKMRTLRMKIAFSLIPLSLLPDTGHGTQMTGLPYPERDSCSRKKKKKKRMLSSLFHVSPDATVKALLSLSFSKQSSLLLSRNYRVDQVRPESSQTVIRLL